MGFEEQRRGANQINDFWVQHAIDVIRNQYGDEVEIQKKSKDLLKFGRNPNVGSASTGYTIWYTGQDQANETYVAANTNSIDKLSCSGSQTGTAVIEGHTESNSQKTFVTQTATLDGQNKVTLSTPLNRVTRVYNSGTSNWTASIFVYEDTSLTSGKPTDTSKIHITVPAGKNQSQKASTSLSSQDYWIITSFRGTVIEKASSFADVALQVRLNGKVFREVEDVGCSDAHNGVFKFKPYYIVPKNADVRLIAISDSTSKDISGSIQGMLAIVN